jgi:hypothetical protein
VVHYGLDDESIIEQQGCDAEQIVVAISVVLVEPQMMGVFVACLAAVDQVGKARVIDVAFGHPRASMTGDFNWAKESLAIHAQTVVTKLVVGEGG